MLKDYLIVLPEEIKGSISYVPSSIPLVTEPNIDYMETPYEPKERRDTGITTFRGCGFGKEETRSRYTVIDRDDDNAE